MGCGGNCGGSKQVNVAPVIRMPRPNQPKMVSKGIPVRNINIIPKR